MNSLVQLVNRLESDERGEIWVDSRVLADEFHKSHDKVLRDIRELECTREFWLANFGERDYQDRGKHYPCFAVSEWGFMRLVMGWTGAKAAIAKERFVEAFKQMRAELRRRAPDLPVLNNAEELTRLPRIEEQIDRLHPKLDEVVNNQKEMLRLFPRRRRNLSDSAKRLHLYVIKVHGGLCPCCSQVAVVDAYARQLKQSSGKFASEWDHFISVDRASIDSTWLICCSCHAAMTAEGHMTYATEFAAYQRRVQKIREGRRVKVMQQQHELLYGRADEDHGRA